MRARASARRRMRPSRGSRGSSPAFRASRNGRAGCERSGHGRREEMSAEKALDVAAKASPETRAENDPGDPNGRKVGDKVVVVPEDHGKVEVGGEIVSL